jgi:APA family basic amino acid/polyamine antiporter
MVAIIGFETASLASERIRDPARNVPRATMGGIAVACTIYLLVCTGITFATPVADLQASDAPVALFIARHWGGWAGDAVAAFAVISTVGCLNVWVLMAGEVPLGLVRAKLLPAWLGRTNSRDIAVAPLMLASALTVALLSIGCWHGGAAIMDFMLTLTAVSGVWIYAFAGFTALKMGIRPIMAVIAILFTAGILVGAGIEANLLGLLLLASALPLYALSQRDLRRAAAPV